MRQLPELLKETQNMASLVSGQVRLAKSLTGDLAPPSGSRIERNASPSGSRFECLCGRSFNMKHGLVQHIRTNHMGMHYKCPVCCSLYTRKPVMKQHLFTAHQITLNPDEMIVSFKDDARKFWEESPGLKLTNRQSASQPGAPTEATNSSMYFLDNKQS